MFLFFQAALLSICFKEGIKISSNSLTELIIGASQDMRQILNLLSMWSSADKNMSAETITQSSKMAKKDIKMVIRYYIALFYFRNFIIIFIYLYLFVINRDHGPHVVRYFQKKNIKP